MELDTFPGHTLDNSQQQSDDVFVTGGGWRSWTTTSDPPGVKGMSQRKRGWVPNFVPNSTAKEILEWLLAFSNGAELDAKGFTTALLAYKRLNHLDQVHLLQLRDYAEFDASLVASSRDDPNVRARKQVARLAESLIAECGIRL